MNQSDRLAYIVGHAEAVGREALARHLAVNSKMTEEEAIQALKLSARTHDAASAASAASAAVARALLGMRADPAADAALGESAARAEASAAAERERVAAERAKFDEEYAAGRGAAEALLGRRH